MTIQVDAGGIEPRITSFTSIGGDLWELTLTADPNTDFEFRSSPTLDFSPGTLIENLVQGDSEDPCTISGPNDNVLTTDGNGDGTVRVTLSGAKNFVRAETP